MRWHELIKRVVFCVVGLCFAGYACAEAASRKFKPRDLMPEFSVVDNQGAEFHYAPGKNSALLVVFFSPEKAQSIKAIADIENKLGTFDDMPQKLSVLAVSDDPNSVGEINIKGTEQLSIHYTKDVDFKLWGTFGVIASPTVFLAGADGKVELIRAGYGYDFAPAIKSGLQVVMGLASEEKVDEATPVKVSKNTSEAGKANRHLKMAQMLEEKGRYDAALTQLQMGLQADPNSVESAIELGRLYCVVADPNKAISAVEGFHPSIKENQSQRAFVLGTAYGQLKDYPAAEKFLLEAVNYDPKNGRAFFELGKIYQLQGNTEKALISYRKSLDLVYSPK